MDKEIMEMFQTILTGMEQMERRLTDKIEDSEMRVSTKIENEITQRLNALTDGYKLNHEKQWELEHRVEDLESRIMRLEVKAG